MRERERERGQLESSELCPCLICVLHKSHTTRVLRMVSSSTHYRMIDVYASIDTSQKNIGRV